MRKSAHKRPFTIKKAIERLGHLLGASSLPLSLTLTPFTEAEQAEAKYLATEMHGKLAARSSQDEPKDTGARRQLLTTVFMYQMLVGGQKAQLEQMLAMTKAQRAAAPTPPVPQVPEQLSPTIDATTIQQEDSANDTEAVSREA